MPTARKRKRVGPDGDPAEESTEQQDQDEEGGTLVLTSSDAWTIFEFSGQDEAKFKELFTFIVELFEKQEEQQQQPGVAMRRGPVIA